LPICDKKEQFSAIFSQMQQLHLSTFSHNEKQQELCETVIVSLVVTIFNPAAE